MRSAMQSLVSSPALPMGQAEPRDGADSRQRARRAAPRKEPMLEAAGFAPVTRSAIDSAAMTEMRRAVELILKRHEPFGAIAWIGIGTSSSPTKATCECTTRCSGHMIEALCTWRRERHSRFLSSGRDAPPRAQLGGGRRAMVPRIVREAATSNDEELRALAKEVLSPCRGFRAFGGIRETFRCRYSSRFNCRRRRDPPTLHHHRHHRDRPRRDAVGLRIESFHPADDETDRLARAIFAG